MDIGEAGEAYLVSLRAEGRSPRTITAYRRDLSRLVAHLGANRDVVDVRPPDLLSFAASDAVMRTDKGTPRSQAGINRIRSVTRGLFAFLERAWVIPANPAKVLRVKRTAAPPTALLSRADETALLTAMVADGSWAARRDALMVRVVLATGIRLSSLVGIDTEHVDLEHGRLTVRVKGGGTQVVWLDPELGQALLDHARGEPGPVFRSARGDRLGARQVQLRFARWKEAAGINRSVTVHGLRHTFGTRLYRQTRDLRRVQVALGHRSVGTTERYVRVEAA